MAGTPPNPEALAEQALLGGMLEQPSGIDLIACEPIGQFVVAVLDVRPAPKGPAEPSGASEWDVLTDYRSSHVTGADPVLTPLNDPDAPGRALLTLTHPFKDPRQVVPGAPNWKYDPGTKAEVLRHYGELAARWALRNAR